MRTPCPPHPPHLGRGIKSGDPLPPGERGGRCAQILLPRRSSEKEKRTPPWDAFSIPASQWSAAQLNLGSSRIVGVRNIRSSVLSVGPTQWLLNNHPRAGMFFIHGSPASATVSVVCIRPPMTMVEPLETSTLVE